MASTRKSSRVRVPKIREDAATPQKRSKPNVTTPSPAVATPAPTPAPAPAPAVVPQPVAPAPAPAPAPAAVPTVAPASVPALDVLQSAPLGLESDVGATSVEESDQLSTTGVGEGGEDLAIEKVATAIFKNPSFVHSSIGAAGSKRTRLWKNLKQIISSERSMAWQNTDVTYGLIEGPPSFKPAKKYSDLSGFEASYTDPQSKLRFSSPEEFSRARTFPSDIVNGYLALRKASAPVP